MSMMTVPSPTSTRLKTTNGLSPVDQFQIERFRLAVAEREPRPAILDLLEELRIRSLTILEIVDGHREISIVRRQCLDAELSLLIGASRLHEARRERPFRRIVWEHHHRVVAGNLALRGRHLAVQIADLVADDDLEAGVVSAAADLA